MAIEEFDEIFNTVYIAKKLFDTGRYGLVEENFYDELCYDTYYENLINLMPELFAHCRNYYNERRGVEIYVLSDPVIVDFYVLAGEYGKKNNIPDEANPYIKAAVEEVRGHLNFSYCLDWMIRGYTSPKRPYHSRLAVFLYQDEWVDYGCLTYALIEIYEWFSDSCTRLKDILHKDKIVVTMHPREEVAAA